MNINPINLLPLNKKPFEDNSYTEEYFYKNVILPLIPDIVRLEANGIPIDLDKVQELEKILNDVLESVKIKLNNNEILKEFLNKCYKQKENEVTKEIKKTFKTPENFLKPFDFKNTVHRTYVINTYLEDINKQDLILESWTIKDLKKLNQILASKFINDLLNKDYNDYVNQYINKGMYALAKNKSDIYNKNKIENKNKKIKKLCSDIYFNPASPIQKQTLFSYLGIEPEKETEKGNPQWDRKELEKLQKQLIVMLEEKDVT